MAKYVMALDAGTTSNRCILFNEQGEICSMAQKEFRQFFPNPGWVEHDANEIWSTMLGVAVEAMNMRILRRSVSPISVRRRLSGTRRLENRSIMRSCGSAAELRTLRMH
jgi:glycerol kinase